MNESLRQEVRERADYACEYCLLPEAVYPFPFEVDHIIARQHGGPTRLSNLALACLHCNNHKGPNLTGIDPATGTLAALFNPRRHKWSRHFRWDGPFLIGRTAIGRATIVVLAINHPTRVALRATLIADGLFPPA